MSRLIFPTGRRTPYPHYSENSISIDSPLTIERPAPEPVWRKALPFVVFLLIIAMIVCMIGMGMRIVSPQMLIYPFIMLLAAGGVMRTQSKKGLSGSELEKARADYLRYLSEKREQVHQEQQLQLESLHWSHPPSNELHSYIGSRRQWERSFTDPDYLHLRVGTGSVPTQLHIRVGEVENEVDLEPVTTTALSQLLESSHKILDAPVVVDFAQIPYLGIMGNYDDVAGVVRAWLMQATLWQEPSILACAIASPNIDTPCWDWAKWLPHCEIAFEVDGAGAARLLHNNNAELVQRLSSFIANRPPFEVNSDRQSRSKHYIVYVDEITDDIVDMIGKTGRKDVTLLYRLDERTDKQLHKYLEHAPYGRGPIVKVCADHGIELYENRTWVHVCDAPEKLDESTARIFSRKLGRWHTALPQHRVESPHSQASSSDFASIMGIEDLSHINVGQMWKRRPRHEELRVPIGMTSSGQPVLFDLKDEAEGGMGPHGLMIGMTGSGKSQTLMAILLSLLTTHSAERLIVIYADFKGEAGADIFREFPQVVAVISNMADKKSLADRFADTLRGEVARRENLLKDLGRKIQGSAFGSVAHYEEAIENRPDKDDFPSIPTLFIVADEFTLMLHDHPEYAEVFDYIARKGRSFRIHILFASQTLDVGRIKDIDKNTSYRMALKVASPSISRQVIGVDNAYHIGAGANNKGVGFLVPAPGAAPIKFRSTYVEGYFEQQREIKYQPIEIETKIHRFIASPIPVETVENIPYDGEESEEIAPHTHLPRKLISLVGEQLASVGPKAPELWLEPLDNPIGLQEVYTRYQESEEHYSDLSWPLGFIDRPFHMRKDPLYFDALSSGANLLIHGGPQSGKSMALQTFIMSAALHHSPAHVQFYIVDFGGASLSSIQDIPHVGSYTSPRTYEKTRRTFAQIRSLLIYRQELFANQGISSMQEYRKIHNPQEDPQDPYGDVFLVIDNLYAFSKDNTDVLHPKNPLIDMVIECANVGLSYGIHIIVTTSNWLDVPMSMRDSIGIKWELRLSNPNESNIRVPGMLYKPAESVPMDQPGRGLTAQGEHFLISEPTEVAVEPSEIPEARQALKDEIASLWSPVKAPQVILLPKDIIAPAVTAPEKPFSEIIPLGIGENQLQEYMHDFTQEPFLLLFGETKSGKTSALRHIINELTSRGNEEDIACTVIDKRLQLTDVNLFPENEFIAHSDRIIPAMLGLNNLLNARRPHENISLEQLRHWKFQGQKHYLIVDDVDTIADTATIGGPHPGVRPWTMISQLLTQAQELGFRVIVTARSGGLSQTLISHTLIKNLYELGARTVMLSGSSHDPVKVYGRKFESLPPGRGWICDRFTPGEYIQLYRSGNHG